MALLSRTLRLLRAVFVDDLGLKFICIALAVLMWFYIDGELMSQKEFELPMRASDISKPDLLELASPDTLPVFIVRVRGPRRLIEFWQHQNLRFKRKLLENPNPGRNAVQPLPSDVEAENFSVVAVTPKDSDNAYVDFVLTAVETKPVRVRLRSEPKEGFLVGKPVYMPAQVKIKGRSEDLAKIKEVWTDEIDIANAEQDVTVDVNVSENLETGGNGFSCSEKIHVTVPITPVVVVRQASFDVWARVPPGLAMTVEPANVQVELVIEARGVDIQDIQSKVSLYVDWPQNWERPKDAKAVSGPTPVQIKYNAPARVRVRGVNGGPLPEVKVTGALAGELKK